VTTSRPRSSRRATWRSECGPVGTWKRGRDGVFGLFLLIVLAVNIFAPARLQTRLIVAAMAVFTVIVLVDMVGRNG
jgi:hypothetical protein